METLKLDMAVGLLTRLSKHRLTDEDGGTHWVTALPLLVQLKMAIANSAMQPTVKGAGGTPIPIASEAYDLYYGSDGIVPVTTHHWWLLHTVHKGQGRGKVATELRAWAMAARTTPEALTEAERIICGWRDAIEGLLNPTRRWEIVGACPECQVSRVVDREEDGHIFTKPALSVVYGPDGKVSNGVCAECGAEWRGDNLRKLAWLVSVQGRLS